MGYIKSSLFISLDGVVEEPGAGTSALGDARCSELRRVNWNWHLPQTEDN